MDSKKNKKKVKVIYQYGLNIRKEPFKESEIVGVLECGQIIEITSKRSGFAHIENGWINLDFVVEV